MEDNKKGSIESMSREELEQAYNNFIEHHDNTMIAKNNHIDNLDKENKKLNNLRNLLIEYLNLDDYITDIVNNCIYDYNLDDVVRDKVEDVLQDARIEI
tara:strand:- start:286 stop:582 length:297 start_codon:yes stop_codon:yes gene_type:complete